MKLPVRMRGSKEREVHVRLEATGLAFVTVSEWPAMARKMTRLYGRSLDGDLHIEGGRKLTVARWRIPLKSVRFYRVPSGKDGKVKPSDRVLLLPDRHVEASLEEEGCEVGVSGLEFEQASKVRRARQSGAESGAS